VLCRAVPRELSELQSRRGDESWVADTELYKQAGRKLADAQAQLEARGKQLVALQHEKDALMRHADNKAAAVEVRGPGGGGPA